MKPRLREDFYLAPFSEGAFVLSHQGPVVFTGSSIHAWLARLAPHLDGSSTLEELTEGQPPERAAMVLRVVEALRERGLLLDAEADAPDALSPEEAQRFAAELAVASASSASAAAGLRRYRDCRFLVVDTGLGAAALAEALRHSGAQHVRVAREGDASPVTDTDLVLRLAGEDAPPVDSRLAGACADAGVPLMQAVVRGEEVWLGPTGGEPRMPWEAAWRRLRDVPAGGGRLADVTTALVAARLVQETFRLLTGAIPPSARPSLIRVDARTLNSEQHPFLPHPFTQEARCPSAAEFLETVVGLQRAPRLEEEEFSRRVMACIDGRLGVLGEVSERGFAQLPLRVAEVTVAAPADGARRGDSLLTLTAAGPGAGVTRLRAAMRGLAAYCCRTVDPRRLLASGSEAPLLADSSPRGAAAVDAVLESLAAGRLSGRVWGLRLTDGGPCLVDATLGFPVLLPAEEGRRSDAEREPVPPGVGAGYDWTEALDAALLEHCLRRTWAELATAQRPYPELALEDAPFEAIGARYRAMLDTLGEPLSIYDVTGSSGVPALAFCVGERTVAYACAKNVASALREGGERVLLAAQARVHGQPEYAPPPVPPLDARLRGPRAGALPPPVDTQALVAALCSGGTVPVALLLDHDPEVSRILPHVVRVVLTHG